MISIKTLSDVTKHVPHFEANGQWYYGQCCGSEGKTPLSAKGSEGEYQGKRYIRVFYKCHKCGKDGVVSNYNKNTLTPTEQTLFEKHLKEKRDLERKALEEHHLERLKACNHFYAQECRELKEEEQECHEYHIAKKILPCYRTEKIGPQGQLVVPYFDDDGMLLSVQSIFRNGNGFVKRYYQGCTLKTGCAYGGITVRGQDTLFIAEGVATARTVEMATGKPCVVSGGCERFEAVAKGMKGIKEKLGVNGTLGALKIILLPDNDASGAGLKAAEKVKKKGLCDGYFLPRFKAKNTAYSDWNDLMLSEGMSEVTEQIKAYLEAPQEEKKEGPLPEKKEKKEKAKGKGGDLISRLLAGGEGEDEEIQIPQEVAAGVEIKGRTIISQVINPITNRPYTATIIRWTNTKKMEIIGDTGISHHIAPASLGPNTLRPICPNNDFWAAIAHYISRGHYHPDWTEIQNILLSLTNKTTSGVKAEVRGPGIYRDSGKTVVHYGNVVKVDGALGEEFLTPEGLTHFYLMGAIEGLSAKREALNQDEIDSLFSLMERFPFRTPLHGHVLVAFLALAQCPKLLKNRPCLWLNATYGVGKTGLIRKLKKMIAIKMDGDNATEASIRNLAGHNPMAVICDEADAYDKNNERRIASLVDSMTKNYSAGFKNYRSTSSQDVIETESNILWIFASIQMMAASEAATSRSIILDINSARRMSPELYMEWESEIDDLINADIASGLFSFMGAKAKRLIKNIEAMSKIWVEIGKKDLIPEHIKKNLSARIRDNYSPLLAALALLKGEELTVEFVEQYLPIVFDDENVSEDFSVGDMGMNILDSMLDLDLDSRFTVRTAIEAILSDSAEAQEEEGRCPTRERREAPTIQSDHALGAMDALAKYGLLFSPKGQELIIPLKNKKLTLAVDKYGYARYASVLKNSEALKPTKIEKPKTITYYRKGQKVIKTSRGYAVKYNQELSRLVP